MGGPDIPPLLVGPEVGGMPRRITEDIIATEALCVFDNPQWSLVLVVISHGFPWVVPQLISTQSKCGSLEQCGSGVKEASDSRTLQTVQCKNDGLYRSLFLSLKPSQYHAQSPSTVLFLHGLSAAISPTTPDSRMISRSRLSHHHCTLLNASGQTAKSASLSLIKRGTRQCSLPPGA